MLHQRRFHPHHILPRLFVEFVRGNDVAWHGLTRPQLVLLVGVPLVLTRILWQWRRGGYAALLDTSTAVVA